MRLRFSIALLIIVAAVSAYAVQRRWKEIERFRHDWRRNGSPLTFILERASDHDWGGEADRLRIVSPHRADFIVEDLDGLDTYRNALQYQPSAMRLARRNPAASKFAFFVPFAESRELLVLTGWGYASSPGSLHVIALDEDGYPHESSIARNSPSST